MYSNVDVDTIPNTASQIIWFGDFHLRMALLTAFLHFCGELSAGCVVFINRRGPALFSCFFSSFHFLARLLMGRHHQCIKTDKMAFYVASARHHAPSTLSR